MTDRLTRRAVLRRTAFSLLPALTLGHLPTAHGRAALSASVSDEQWTDPMRSRTLPVRLRWPEGSPPPGGWPVVLFSHGLGGTVDAGTVFAQAWAAAGLLVLHLQHPGSDAAVLRDGGLRGFHAAASAEQLVARVSDVRFVLDEIARRHAAGIGRWRDARPAAPGLAGHSFGAHTTLAVAGQRFPVGPTLADPRPAAFAALSPSPPQRGDMTTAFGAITRPVLCLTGTLDDDVIGNGATAERRARVVEALPPGRRAGLVLEDADHMTFAGQAGGRLERLRQRPEAARAAQPRHHALLAQISTDWWRWTLQGDATARERLRQPEGLKSGDRWAID